MGGDNLFVFLQANNDFHSSMNEEHQKLAKSMNSQYLLSTTIYYSLHIFFNHQVNNVFSSIQATHI